MDKLKSNKSDITAFVIAGGKSRRFGRDKRKFCINGLTLAARTISLLKTLLGRDPYIVGDNLDGLEIGSAVPLKDARSDSGPLGGIVSALDECSTKWALILAVDLPNLSLQDLEALLLALDDSFDMIALSANGFPEPLIGLYKQETLPFWRERLSQSRLVLSDGLIKLKYRTVPSPGGKRSLHNINNPMDINYLEK